jgi:hypothetical protein
MRSRIPACIARAAQQPGFRSAWSAIARSFRPMDGLLSKPRTSAACPEVGVTGERPEAAQR